MAKLPWRGEALDNTVAAAAEIFTLPCFPEMTEEEVDGVCSAIRRVGREIG
jgi:dTDP-4-amino-4,6-dideoxygalactose transaminase